MVKKEEIKEFLKPDRKKILITTILLIFLLLFMKKSLDYTHPGSIYPEIPAPLSYVWWFIYIILEMPALYISTVLTYFTGSNFIISLTLFYTGFIIWTYFLSCSIILEYKKLKSKK